MTGAWLADHRVSNPLDTTWTGRASAWLPVATLALDILPKQQIKYGRVAWEQALARVSGLVGNKSYLIMFGSWAGMGMTWAFVGASS
jgi:hypothetical protein